MKREADSLRQTVRELARELAEEKVMPMNEMGITTYNDKVVSLRLFFRDVGELTMKPMNLTSQQAVELAAWLVVAAGLGEQMNLHEAKEYFERAWREAASS